MHKKMNSTHYDKLIRKTPYISREELLHKRSFISSYHKAKLYSMFEKNQITKKQYDACLEYMNEPSTK